MFFGYKFFIAIKTIKEGISKKQLYMRLKKHIASMTLKGIIK